MKFGITKYEKFAVTSHLVGLPSPNPEHARKRLHAWDELGVADLADSLAMGATMGGEIQLAEWRDKTTMHPVDLSPDILAHIIGGLSDKIAGVWVDTLSRLRERLERLRDKTYELPTELRGPQAVAS
jgi:hypothetical protein